MNERYMIVSYYLKPNGKWDEITEDVAVTGGAEQAADDTGFVAVVD